MFFSYQMSIRYSPLRRCFCRNRFRRLCCQLMIQQNHLWKTLVALICLLLAVATLVVLFLYVSPNSSLYDDLDDLLSTDQQHLNSTLLHQKYLLYTPQCILRAIPLFDEQTRPFYSPPSNREYYCPPENPISAQIRRVNYTGVSVPQAGCQATEVERDPSNEGFRYGRKIYFGKRLLVDFPTADAVEVHCGGQTKVIPLIPSKKPIWRNEFSTSSPPSPSSQPNILAIGVDSISRLQFLRHFTSTQEFITKKRFEGPLYGLHKVGDNTFPNLMAMFTGLDREGVEELIPSSSRKLDALPLIFKQFSAKGYMTTYIEDMPTAG